MRGGNFGLVHRFSLLCVSSLLFAFSPFSRSSLIVGFGFAFDSKLDSRLDSIWIYFALGLGSELHMIWIWA